MLRSPVRALVHQTELSAQQSAVQGAEGALRALAHLDEDGVPNRWQGSLEEGMT